MFFFTENLAVTASGQNLEQLQLKNDEIYGEDIPPTLRLRNPVGAILYHPGRIYEKIPVIISRKDCKVALDKLVREYFLSFLNFKGHSAKGGIKINVWQKDLPRKSFLIFLKNGQIFGSDNNLLPITSKNFSKFNVNILSEIVNMIAGIWIYPPEIGMNQITAEILRLMQSGPLLFEYWDGLSWQFLEQAFLSQVVENIPGDIRMAFSLFPPETAINYSAMISGGLPEIDGRQNLFIGLASRGIEYQVLEGKKLIFPIPGNVKMHTVSSPEQKDADLFSEQFHFDYLKKGKPLKGHFKGIRLINLVKGIDIALVKKVVAFSFDGHQVAYSNDDLVNNNLVLGLELGYENLIEAFTLYPLKDKFPNRMVRQLKRIEVF